MAFVVLVCFGIVARSEADDTTYNKGVDAYKAKKYAAAISNWSDSALVGNINAVNNLAYLIYSGLGIDTDKERAIKLWRLAAYAGQSESQWHLGVAFEKGAGVLPDRAKAYGWYRCALETSSKKAHGDETEAAIAKDARASLDALEGKLDAVELVRGRSLAADYLRRYAAPEP